MIGMPDCYSCCSHSRTGSFIKASWTEPDAHPTRYPDLPSTPSALHWPTSSHPSNEALGPSPIVALHRNDDCLSTSSTASSSRSHRRNASGCARATLGFHTALGRLARRGAALTHAIRQPLLLACAAQAVPAVLGHCTLDDVANASAIFVRTLLIVPLPF